MPSMPAMTKYLALLGLTLQLAATAIPGHAEEAALDTSLTEAASSSASAQAGAKEFNFSLAKLIGSGRISTLKGESGQLGFSLPVPPTWQAKDVELRLRGTVSSSLIAGSQLVVYLNGEAIQQYPLQQEGNRYDFTLKVPVEKLKSGFNDFQLQANQHYTEACEFPHAPQLWTQVNLEQSGFKINATPKPVVSSLSRLSEIFSKANWHDRPAVSIMTAAKPTPDEVAAMGLLAQGVAGFYDFVPVRISHDVYPLEAHNLLGQFPADSRTAVVMGSFANLGSYLQGLNIGKQDKPVIAVRAMPGDPTRQLVILAANNGKDLKKLATAFALRGLPWPDHAWTSIDKLKMPPARSLEKRFDLPLASSGAFPLRALGYKTTTYSGQDNDGPVLRVWNNSWQGRMQVRVHLTYASGMSPQSSLNIISNGVMQGAIPLNNPRGGIYENYAVTIPAGSLNPGWNTLQFKPVLVPVSNGGKCQPSYDGNLALTVYEDTTLQKFGGDELREPDLALLSGTGSIYTEGPLGKGIAIQMTDDNSDTLSSGLTLVAKLTQVFRRPLMNVWFGVGPAPEMKHQYWIGSYKQLPRDVASLVVTDFPSRIAVEVPIIQSATVEVREGNEWLRSTLENMGIRNTPPAKYTSAEIALSGQFNKYSFAATKEIDGNVVTVLSANSPAILKQGVATLIGYGQWAQLKGRLAFWEPGSEKLSSVSYDDTPFSAYGLRGGLGIWVSQYPWLALFSLLLIIGFIIFVTRRALAAYKVRNHAGHQE